MNKRLAEKEEKEKRQLLHRMLDVALDINGLGQRQQKISGNLPTAFFEFHGNTAHAEIGIIQEGWRYGNKNDDVGIEVWLDDPIGLTTEEAIREIEKYKK